ncbi:DUF2931 family protein [Flavobacterium sp. PL002]|uniref:DUF2931 family protein n=1 Tax=Flavobacterium sp. PL002 TaxID=1897058 RepID=UPI001787DD01|nr:DUF2931 family protein [Flavobacterium sp. PL002]MBE0392327.1 hypothetical protein [Flavobacterium sp. PL002]
MKNIKIHLYAVLMLLTLTSSCQNKNQDKKMNEPEFEWVENLNCPTGYPIAVYRGGLEGNGFASLSDRLSTGIRGWGSSGNGLSYGVKPLPSRINCIWVSYAENCTYSIDSDIDYEKMVQLFKEGYQDSSFFFNGDGEYKKTTFDTVLVGFAPGGVVVIWALGAGKTAEVGRYKGEKYTVPQSEINKLDNHERLLFDATDRKNIMNNTKVIPLEVREANAGKPIPYGLWDTYRTRYSWRPIFILRTEGEMAMSYIDMFNGEAEYLFDEELIENNFKKRSIPKSFDLGWRDKKGQGYGGDILFDEQEIFNAFQEIYKEDKVTEAELQFSINYTNDYVTVLLKQGEKEIRLSKTKVNIYKSSSLTLKK